MLKSSGNPLFGKLKSGACFYLFYFFSRVESVQDLSVTQCLMDYLILIPLRRQGVDIQLFSNISQDGMPTQKY